MSWAGWSPRGTGMRPASGTQTSTGAVLGATHHPRAHARVAALAALAMRVSSSGTIRSATGNTGRSSELLRSGGEW